MSIFHALVKFIRDINAGSTTVCCLGNPETVLKESAMSNYCFKDEEWERLYPLLHARVARWVYTSSIPLWMKQREAIIEDIVGDTILKTFAYTKRAERGEAREVDSLESISTVTAYHCYVDAHRRDQR